MGFNDLVGTWKTQTKTAFARGSSSHRGVPLKQLALKFFINARTSIAHDNPPIAVNANCNDIPLGAELQRVAQKIVKYST